MSSSGRFRWLDAAGAHHGARGGAGGRPGAAASRGAVEAALEAALRVGPEGAALVRPDGVVAARWQALPVDPAREVAEARRVALWRAQTRT